MNLLSILRTPLANSQDLRALPRQIAASREALVVIILTLVPWSVLVVLKPDIAQLGSLGEIAALIGLYWFATRRRPVTLPQVKKPRIELLIAIGLVGFWILYRVAEYWKWFVVPNWEATLCPDLNSTLLPKLAEMVLVPLGVLLVLRYAPREWGMNWSWWAWLLALGPIAALIVQGVTTHPIDKFASSSFCYYFAAGLPEEFLFRMWLQTRIDAWLHRPLFAIWLGAFLFGLSHVPINLHGSFEHWQDALLTALTYQMGVGLALGYAYRRTATILPLTFLHAFIDSAP